MTDAGAPTPPPSSPPSPQPSVPAGWGSSPVGPPPSTAVTHPATSTIAHPRGPRKRWIVVLVGVLVLVAGIGVAGTVLFVTNTLPPLEATMDFTNDLEDSRYASAYDQMCDRVQNVIDVDTLARFAGDFSADYVVNPFSVNRNGNHATVDFSVQRIGGREVQYELYLVHEDGDWKPCAEGGLFR